MPHSESGLESVEPESPGGQRKRKYENLWNQVHQRKAFLTLLETQGVESVIGQSSFLPCLLLRYSYSPKMPLLFHDSWVPVSSCCHEKAFPWWYMTTSFSLLKYWIKFMVPVFLNQGVIRQWAGQIWFKADCSTSQWLLLALIKTPSLSREDALH